MAVGVVLNEDIDIVDRIEEDPVFEAVTVTVATQEGVITRQTVEEGEREGLSTATPDIKIHVHDIKIHNHMTT